jgi:hypothetical protein
LHVKFNVKSNTFHSCQHDVLAYASADFLECPFPSCSITFLSSLPCHSLVVHFPIYLSCPPLTLPLSIKSSCILSVLHLINQLIYPLSPVSLSSLALLSSSLLRSSSMTPDIFDRTYLKSRIDNCERAQHIS